EVAIRRGLSLPLTPTGRGDENNRRQCQCGQRIRDEALSPEERVLVYALPTRCEHDNPCVEEGDEKWRDEYGTGDKGHHAAQIVQPWHAAREPNYSRGTKEGLAAVRNIQPQDRPGRDTILGFDQHMRGKYCQEQEPPGSGGDEQECGKQNGI